MNEVQWLVGVKILKAINYRVEERLVKRKFWFDKKEYYVVSDYCSLGPFKTFNEAYEIYAIARAI